MKIVRWLGGGICEYMETDKDLIQTPRSCAEFEKNPNREVCAELFPTWEKSQRGADIGLLLDIEKSKISRIYAVDGWTEMLEDGTIRSPREGNVEMMPDWSDRIVDAKRVYYSVDPDTREEWAEVIVSEPVYQAIVVKGSNHNLDEYLPVLVETFDLPIIVID